MGFGDGFDDGEPEAETVAVARAAVVKPLEGGARLGVGLGVSEQPQIVGALRAPLGARG